MLTTAGDHVPLMPLFDVAGRTGTAVPEQITCSLPKLKVGVSMGCTVTTKVTLLIHSPGKLLGVKVYTPEVCASTTAGFQVPSIPLTDVVGSAGTVLPAQIVNAVPKVNAGIVLGVTFSVNDVVVPHWPAAGVNE